MSKEKCVNEKKETEDLMILYEYEYSPVTVRTLPLFKKAIYEDSIYPTEQLADLSCPVFAFHSYKGGVGRTLSLIAFARAWTNLQKNPENSKLLIIDSDLEAPGLRRDIKSGFFK